MRERRWAEAVLAGLFVLQALSLAAVVTKDVNPFIGTMGTAHTTPAAACPFGLVQPGPDTGWGDWAHCSGYQLEDARIFGFSQNHLSGTGCAGLADLRLLPYYDDPVSAAKSDEVASPGFYAVTLGEGKTSIRAEMTATERVAFYRFTGASDGLRLVLDPEWGLGRRDNGEGYYVSPIRSAALHRTGPRTYGGRISRRGWCDRDIWFAAEFSQDFDETNLVRDVRLYRAISDPKASCAQPRCTYERERARSLSFGLGAGRPLCVKVALSTRSYKAAVRNLSVELPGWDFQAAHRAARDGWTSLLSRVEVDADERTRRTLATAFYHLFFQPNDISDAGEPPDYSTLSLWDTFRAAHPLYNLVTPERTAGFVKSLVRHFERNGFLPIWSLGGVDTQCMIGSHSVPVIVDAYFLSREQGAPSELAAVDWDAAYAAVRDTLRAVHPERGKEGWPELDRYGYFPCDLAYPEPVSRTLECAYDDACAARFARALGKAEDAAFFERRSRSWRNLLDGETGFFRPRRADGSFVSPFDPCEHGSGRRKNLWFTEGNAWQYRWHVLHDVGGLVAALGGKERFASELERFFTLPTPEAHGDVSGLIGQYAHGNEPSHHVIYLFNYAGRRDLLAKYLKRTCDEYYRPTPDGLCGNEDCGQMSAWYVFACMGFYPVDPCGGEFVLGFPQVDRLTLSPPGQRSFTVVREPGAEPDGPVTLNGRPLDGFMLSREQIRGGGELRFCKKANERNER